MCQIFLLNSINKFDGIDVVNMKQVVFAETPKEYSDAIIALSSDPTMRKELSLNGRRLIEEVYCYEKIGESLARVYRQVVERTVPSVADLRIVSGIDATR